MLMWIDVWDGVKELNTRILRDRHNLDYNKLCMDMYDSKIRVEWILKYSRAMIHEVAEFYEEENEHKSKIELIDVLFFFTAVLQLTGTSYERFFDIITAPHIPFKAVEWYAENMIFSAIKVEDEIAWKHWKTYDTDADINIKFYMETEKFVEDWKEHVYVIYEMTDDSIFKAFEDKLAVNHSRQDYGYTVKKQNDDIHVRTK